ncbi:MAG: thioesterase family protein [Thermoplasmata archaeon]
MVLEEGMEFIKKFKTSLEHSAKNIGSGDVEVLSTPSLILFIENTARELIDNSLGNEMISVGTIVDIKHIKASKIGDDVTIKVKLLTIDSNRYTFWAEAFSNGKRIAYGIHERAKVEKSKFLSSLK